MIYLDAAASALKPESVIRAEMEFLRNEYANAGRGICARANRVDERVAGARHAVAAFIHAARDEQIIFTSGATDGLNRARNILLASGMVHGDSVVVVSDLDHHSARLPWADLARRGGCKLVVAELDADFNIDINTPPVGFADTPPASGVGQRADVFVITAMSNVIGMAQDVAGLIRAARAANPDVITIVDAAQYVAHAVINVVEWDTDFVCFSGHKIGADTGVGVMYVREPERWTPDKLGGGMVRTVSGNEWTTASSPAVLEAGTLPITQIIGLAAAIDEKQKTINEKQGTDVLRNKLAEIGRVRFISPAGASVISFTVDGMAALDFGAMAGARGICLRVGNMCASWIHARLSVPASIRLSPGPWNTMVEIEQAAEIIKSVIDNKK